MGDGVGGKFSLGWFSGGKFSCGVGAILQGTFFPGAFFLEPTEAELLLVCLFS